ncbi:MAG TPA: GNAT family N-acetyltransferase [Terrimicrobiaceae bacterium]|nr:GNAT family N-acetyltransferase [Terrimicrobiaceae bacterium]
MSESQSCTASFVPLVPALIASAVRLSEQAGWNQLAGDWERTLRLAPEGVKVWTDETGEVRASYSVIGYGRRVAWIGMILVDTAWRGKGLGKLAFAGALEDARAAGYAVLGLDATDLGEPIYRKFGFAVCRPIARWGGILRSAAAPEGTPEIREGFSPELAKLDRDVCGEDRSLVLADLADHGGRLIRLEEDGRTEAYAGIRPGRNAFHLGPVVARSGDAAGRILDAAARVLGGRKVFADVFEMGSAAFAARGLEPMRQLQRMTLPLERDCLCRDGVWCAAGFELG